MMPWTSVDDKESASLNVGRGEISSVLYLICRFR